MFVVVVVVVPMRALHHELRRAYLVTCFFVGFRWGLGGRGNNAGRERVGNIGISYAYHQYYHTLFNLYTASSNMDSPTGI